MSKRNYTVTVKCTGDIAEANENLDAYVAGLIAAGQVFNSKFLQPEGPEAVDAPALNALNGGSVKITAPNFVVEEGVTYYLDYTDDGETWTTISDNVGPNDENYHSYNATRKWRITAHWDGNLTPGESAGPIP